MMPRTDPVPLRVIPATGLIALAGLIGCHSQEQEPVGESAQWAKIELTSTAFAEGQPIPQKYTREGENVSPPLSWSSLPKGTKELALICDVHVNDAPGGDWVHWIVYKIPVAASGLPEDFSRIHWQDLFSEEYRRDLYYLDLSHWRANAKRGPRPSLRPSRQPLIGVKQGLNTFRCFRYGDPTRPRVYDKRRYMYIFTLYALDSDLTLGGFLHKQSLLAAMEGHILAEAELTGTYER